MTTAAATPAATITGLEPLRYETTGSAPGATSEPTETYPVAHTAPPKSATATLVGAGASTAGYAGSTALGAGALNTAEDQMMLGGANTTYAAPGLASAASLAAQQGATKFVSSDAAGRLATSPYGPNDITRLDATVANVANGLTNLGAAVAVGFANMNQNMQNLERRAYQAVAI